MAVAVADPAIEPVGLIDFDRYRLSDSGYAFRFLDRNRESIRFSVPWDSWVVWDGKRWVKDVGRQAVQVAIETARQIIPLELDDFKVKLLEEDISEKEEFRRIKSFEKWALHCEDKTPINSMLSIASTDATIHVHPDEFDMDPALLCCANGVLDMDTLILHPHERMYGCSRIVPVEYDPSATCPTFLRFLWSVQTEEKIEYLQRVTGYSGSGFTSEQKAWFHLGAGQNGKGTFKDVISAILGDYGTTANFKTFMASSDQGEKARPDLARLQGVRLILTSEVEKGKKLSEALFKQFTGQDKINARFLHENEVEFLPRGKIWLLCNHLPQISGTDFGIWRRIQRFDWDIIIPDNEVDFGLRDKLMAELPGILNWIVEGYRKWRFDGGLKTPEAIKNANAEYRKSQDWLSGFMDECIQPIEGGFVSLEAMFRRYKQWVSDGEEKFEVSKRKFNELLRERKLEEGRNTKGDTRGWKGVDIVV